MIAAAEASAFRGALATSRARTLPSAEFTRIRQQDEYIATTPTIAIIPWFFAGARDAGFEVVETSGFFQIVPPALGFDLHASTIAAAKSSVIESGVTSGDEIDALECSLRAAEDGGHNWVTTPSYLALTARAQPS